MLFYYCSHFFYLDARTLAVRTRYARSQLKTELNVNAGLDLDGEETKAAAKVSSRMEIAKFYQKLNVHC